MASLTAPGSDSLGAAMSAFLTRLPDAEQVLCRQTTSLDALLQDLKSLDDGHRAQSKSRRFMEKIQPTLRSLESFGKSLDILSSAKPEILGLLWGGIRLLIQVSFHILEKNIKFHVLMLINKLSNNFLDYFEKTLHLLSQIGDCLYRFQIYAKLYPRSQRMLEVLIRTYGHILEFIWDCRSFFVQAKRDTISISGHFSFVKTLWKTLKCKNDTICGRIREDCDLVDREASTIEKEEAYNERMAQRQERRQQQERWTEHELFHKKVRNQIESQAVDKICRWLSAPDPSTNQDAAHRKRQAQTGLWFLDGREFAEWKSGTASFLWLYGIPGCGKTILCSTIVEAMLNYCKSPLYPVIYFYFNFSDQEKRTYKNLVASLLTQLCTVKKDLPKAVQELYSRNDDGTKQAKIEDLEETVYAVLKYYPKTFIILDALDECGDRENLLSFIQRLLLRRNPSNAYLLALSRREVDIEHVLTGLATYEVCLQSTFVKPDIELHVKERLKNDSRLSKWPSDLKEKVSEGLIEGANGMFQWVVCQFNELLACKTPYAVKMALRSLPRTLDDTYVRILAGIPEAHAEDAFRIFQWIIHSSRPLRIEEVAELLAFNPDHDPHFDIERRLFDPKQLQFILSNLAIFSTANINIYGNHNIDTITFTHFSVQEFLVSDRISASSVSRYRITQSSAQCSIARTCLSYILQFDKPDSLNPDTYEEFPLARYAAQYWAQHVRKSSREDTMHTNQSLIDELLVDDADVFLNWNKIYDPLSDFVRDCTQTLKRPSVALLCASVLGLEEPVRKLLDSTEDVDYPGLGFDSPLLAAATKGHAKIVRLLIEHGADIELPSFSHFWGMKPLGAAAQNGHEEVLKVLLDSGAKLDAYIGDGDYDIIYEEGSDCALTALHRACMSGYENIACILVDKKASLEVKDGYGSTPLITASSYGSKKSIVRFLLDAGANVSAVEYLGATALSQAFCTLHDGGSKSECLDIIRLLFNRGADPNAMATLKGENSTILHAEAINGDIELVRLLIAHGAEIDRSNDDGETPLMAAASSGYEIISRVLLEAGANTSIRRHEDESTALSLSAAAGHDSIVQLLLDKDHINGSEAEKWLATARLYNAINRGNNDKVRELLRMGANPHIRSLGGRISIQYAARGGHDAIIALLLEREVDINVTDGRDTPLSIAAAEGHESTARFLVDRGALTNSAQVGGPNYVRSALYAASSIGHSGLVQLLIDRGADVLRLEDINQETALHVAARNGHHSVVPLLLGKVPGHLGIYANDFNDIERGVIKLTACMLAAKNGHVATVQVLLEYGADLEASSIGTNNIPNGQTALYLAASYGHEATVRLLLEKGANFAAQDVLGRTPLSAANSHGHKEVARLLREHTKIRLG